MAKRELTTKGIVIREVMMGESDKLLTVLTPELGRITVRCRGVRTLKSHRFAAAQLYIYSEMILSEKDGLYSLSEAEPIESFFDIRLRLEAIACSDYFADLVNTVSMEGEGDAEIMRLFLNSLYALAYRPELSVRLVKAVFEARLAALLGFMPDMTACASCGENEPAFLDVSGGEVLCRDCMLSAKETFDGGERLLLPVNSGVVSLFSYVANCEAKRIFAFTVEDEVLDLFCRLTERYLLYYIDKKPDTLTFLLSVL